MPKFTATERDAILSRWDWAFGRALAGFREAAGLGQQDLANRMGWNSRTTIAKIESGERPASASETRLLAQVLDVKHADMLKITESWFSVSGDPNALTAVNPPYPPNADR